MSIEKFSHTDNQSEWELQQLLIRVYGEAIVELGGKEYIINAPEGVTIRERGRNHESLS